MSGICAVWRKQDPARAGETLALVAEGLAPGPEEKIQRKIVEGAGVAVSALFSTQQVFSNDNVALACDADLANHTDLAALTGQPSSSGPAVLIAALYERYGASFAEKLNGSFSVVLWDRREGTLLAAVDGFGINRLVYSDAGGIVLVASRIDALLRAGECAADVNPRAIANFVNFGVNLAPETIVQQIRRIPPGTMLLARRGESRLQQYWDMRYNAEDEREGERKLSERLENLVERAVAARARTNGSIGAYLSGGTDSSTVLGMMTRASGAGAKAFSIGFEEQRFNELEYAEIAARKFQANHHTYIVSAADCFEALPRMVRYFDEPFANSSAIPTYFCARLAAANGVRTLLAGDGGDELFGGNERYLTDKVFSVYQQVPQVFRKGLLEPVLNWAPFENGPVGKARRYVRRSNIPPVERFYSYNLLSAHPPREVFCDDFLAQLGNYSVLDVPSRYYRDAVAHDHLDRLLYLDVKITLGDSDLPKVTQMSELAGIQTQFPFLDRSVAEFSGRIPAHLKVKGMKKRYLFKRAFRNLLPVEVIQKKKHGFGIPVATWLKSDRRMREFSRDILFSARSLGRGYFRREFLDGLIRLHESDDSTYYGDNIWSFLILELWHQQFADQPVRTAA